MRVAWRRKALGWFLEFRLIPVLLWGYTAVALGASLAYADDGRVGLMWLALSMALAGLVQGWVTHAVNDIYDGRSGTDGFGSPRALSGGSKVLGMRLLVERDLWAILAVSTAGVAALALLAGALRAWWLVLLVIAGYGIGVAYTAPRVATAYRPFAGEWLGGFPGVLLAGLGAYGIQALRLSWTALAVLSAHALVCTAMLVMHHYADAAADAAARPVKRTTVVALGPRRARGYATLLAGGAAVLYGALGLLLHPAFLAGAALTALAALFHARTDPSDLRSVTRNELRVIQLGIAAGLVPAALLAPPLWPLLPIAVLGYFAHLIAVSPPTGLARAWRAAPAADARRR